MAGRRKVRRGARRESRAAMQQRMADWPRLVVRVAPDVFETLRVFAVYNRAHPGDVVTAALRERLNGFYVVDKRGEVGAALRPVAGQVGPEADASGDCPPAGDDAQAAA